MWAVREDPRRDRTALAPNCDRGVNFLHLGESDERSDPSAVPVDHPSYDGSCEAQADGIFIESLWKLPSGWMKKTGARRV